MSRWLFPAIFVGTLSFSLGVACTLNPQGLPPGTPGDDSGVGDGASNDGASTGPAACVASGGQCILGGNKCVHLGTADCNPDRNPGGAFCCLDDVRAAVCPAPLTTPKFGSRPDLPVAEICASSGGRLREWKSPCAGSDVVVVGEGVDCETVYLFDPTTRALQAVGHGCNAGAQCTEGDPGFTFPSACFDGNFTTDVVDLCTDAGSSGGEDGGGDATDDSAVDAAHA